MAVFTGLAAPPTHLHAAEVVQEFGHHKAGLRLHNPDVVLKVHGSLQGALLGPPAPHVRWVQVQDTGWAGTALSCAAQLSSSGVIRRSSCSAASSPAAGSLLGPPATTPQWHMIWA